MTAPPPLTPARSDLRDFGFMPLEIVRFRGSDLLSEDAEVVLAAIMLWSAAWHETPAASLTDDDKALARAAGYGRSVAGWLAVKQGALRGFVKCSDGRLYHPVVARLANEAWKGKVEQRHRTEVARRKKHNERHPENALPIPSFEAFASHYPDNCPDDIGALSPRQPEFVLATPPEKSDDNGSKGQGQGQGQGESYNNSDDAREKSAPPSPVETKAKFDLLETTRRLASIGAVSVVQPTKIAREMDIVKGWIEAGIAIEETIVPTIEAKVADLPERETVGGLAFFDAAIHKAHNRKARPKRSAPSTPAATLDEQDDDDERVTAFRAHLKAAVGPRTYDGWMKPGTTAIHVNGETTTVKAASSFMADWIGSNMGAQLLASAEAAGCPLDIRIERP